MAPEAAPAPNPSIPMVEPIFKCPKCNKHHMCLRAKKDNNGYFFTCMGRPECTHAIWLADVIKEIKVTNDCPKCRNGNKKVLIKFKTNNLLAMLNAALINDEDRTYESCILCDASLRVILDINTASIRFDPNAAANRPNQPTNRAMPNQNTARTNTNTNVRPPYVSPPHNRPNLPNPRPNSYPNPNPNGNQSFQNPGNVKCTGCNQPAIK